MSTSFATAPAPARVGDASTYNGFYLRNNLSSQGKVPALSPYNLCPDIIQSDAPVENPQSVFSSISSWQTLYNTAPTVGTNYYYVRGLDGGTDAFSGAVSLYWAPAQLILFPSTWKNNPLATAQGQESVPVSAAPGHIGVGADAFILEKAGQMAPSNETFYSFVAQNTATPIPEISSWMQMSQLMTQQLAFGFRNMVNFDPVAGPMLFRVGLNVPFSVGQSGTLQLTLTASGFQAGDTVGFIGDCFTPEMKQIVLEPVATQGGPYVAGIQISVDPGFSTSLAIQYWNTASTVPPPGSTLTLTANYVVPPEQLEEALRLNIIDSQYALQHSQVGLSAGPQPVAPLGAVSFVVAPVPA